jgi:hypothetical protein
VQGGISSELPGRMAGKTQIPNTKHQITNKSQVPNSNDPNNDRDTWTKFQVYVIRE